DLNVTGVQTCALPIYSEKKKIRRLFKSEAVVPHKSCCQILDVVASVIQTARAWNFFAVHYFYSLHVRYLRKSCKDALTVYITQKIGRASCRTEWRGLR